MIAEELLDGQAEQLVRKTIELAMAGDTACLRLLMERLIPPRRERKCSFELPELSDARDVRVLLEAILKGVSTGSLSPTEAVDVSKVAGLFVTALQMENLDERLVALERISKR